MNFTAGLDYSEIVKTTDKPADSTAPNSLAGHMLASAYEFILYGGAIQHTNSITFPPVTWGIAKDIRKRDPVPLAKPDWRTISTLDGATRGIVGGATVNIPSEDLSIVIGGSRVGPSYCVIMMMVMLKIVGDELG